MNKNHHVTGHSLRQHWIHSGRRVMVLFACLVLVLNWAGPVWADPTNAPTATGELAAAGINDAVSNLDEQHELMAGDHLFFQILEDTDAPKELIVTDSGYIQVPCVGHVSVKGLTCKQLAFQLKKELEAKYYRHATVIIFVVLMSNNLGNVYLSGAVRAPGRLQVPGNDVFTLSKAVLCAGGFTDLADQRGVIVTRRSAVGATNEFYKVDVLQILEKGRTEKDLRLKNGDVIYVPEQFKLF